MIETVQSKFMNNTEILNNSLNTKEIRFSFFDLETLWINSPKMLWITSSFDLAIFELTLYFNIVLTSRFLFQNWNIELSQLSD